MTPFNTFGNPQNPPLHFAHANGFPPLVYRQFLELLGEQYHVSAVHHRPLWDSNLPDRDLNGWQQVADDMLHFFEAQNAQGIIGVGHSMGAVSTLYAALARPETFSKLLFIEPVFLPAELLDMLSAKPDAEPAFNPMFQGAMKRRNQWATREEAWQRFRGKKNFAKLSDEVLWDYVRGITVPNGDGFKLIQPREWEAHFYAMPPLDIWEKLPQVMHPTLAIRATETDTLFPPAWELWQQLQPAATFIELPDLGHLLMLEDPQLVADTVLNWLTADNSS